MKNTTTIRKTTFFKSRKFRVIMIVIAVLVLFRIFLPYIVLRYSNKKLAEMDGYYGKLQDVDISLYRGAYKLKNIYINKVDSNTQKQTRFFDARLVDLSVEWRALFKGRLTGELIFENPHLYFTKDKAEPGQVRKDSNDFRKLLKDFMPLQVNRFEVNDGAIHYVDEGSSPKVDVKMDRVRILARNLKNVEDTSLLPARVEARADLYGGKLNFNMKMDPIAEKSTFDMNSSLKSTRLVELNDFFKAYAKADVNKGTFGLYTEIAAKDGKFKGYVKPFIKDLKVLGAEDRKDNIFQKVWEGVVGTAGAMLTNPKKDQIATKIPLQGKTGSGTQSDTWYAILDLLRNAFIQALQPAIDNEINIQSVQEPPEQKKGFFKRLFSKKEDKKDKKK